MKTQPNPALKNTAIFVGNDAELRKKAIEYYEENGYPTYSLTNALNFHYIATMTCNTKVSDYPKQSIECNNQIITLPTEPKSEYPKMMLVCNSNTPEFKKNVVGEFNGRYLTIEENQRISDLVYVAWEFAKDIPTVTLTQSELIEAYEKSNNVKVIIK